MMNPPAMNSPSNQALANEFTDQADWAARGTILRKIGQHHFAFLKGHLEGLDLRLLAERYLESVDLPGGDLRQAHFTLRWIRSELAMLARRHGQFGYARIIALSPDKMAGSGATSAAQATPSLDAFREECDPDGFYTESELIELYTEHYPPQRPDRKAARNQRLREKQARALVWLEARADLAPALDDRVDGWLASALSSRLVAVGITTLRELLAIINGRGQRWYVTIPQLGERSAARILRWLDLSATALGTPVGQHVLVKRSRMDRAAVVAQRPREEAIVPLEFFRPRAEIDGSAGENRGERNRSGVDNDYDAIRLWLSTITPDSNTWRSYRKEAERFLLWAILERGKPLSSLRTQDCIAYRDFLSDLGRLSDKSWSLAYHIPQDQWLGKRGTPRWSALWRPFEQLPPLKPPTDQSPEELAQWREKQQENHSYRRGVLSDSSQKLAQTILKSMCEWLMRQRYLDSNPWDGVPTRKNPATRMQTVRCFTKSQWGFLMQYLDGMVHDGRHARLRFVLLFAYGTGLRLSELTGSRICDLKYQETKDQRTEAWTLNVIGKGDKERVVVVPSLVRKELHAYLAHRGYATFNDAPQDAPLIDRLVGVPFPARLDDKPIAPAVDQLKLSDQALYKILKSFFTKASLAMQAESVTEARHIAQASTHWLRHTCGAHAVANGVSIEVLQATSVNTTSIYITAEMDRRIEEMERFMQVASE